MRWRAAGGGYESASQFSREPVWVTAAA